MVSPQTKYYQPTTLTQMPLYESFTGVVISKCRDLAVIEQYWVNMKTYNPFCMGFNLTRMYLKSGRASGSSCQHSCMHLVMKSSHGSLATSGRNGHEIHGPFTISITSVKEEKLFSCLINLLIKLTMLLSAVAAQIG